MGLARGNAEEKQTAQVRVLRSLLRARGGGGIRRVTLHAGRDAAANDDEHKGPE